MEIMARKTALIAFALLLIAGFSFASVNPKVQLQNYSISSVPAQPGEVLKLTLHMKSVESDNCAERVAVTLAVSYPLSVRGPDTQYLDSLCFRDPETKGDFTFYLPVDNLATSGTYPISVSTAYEKRFTKLSESNTLNVQVGGSPEFISSVASSSPADIYPGDTAQLTVNFQNTGASTAQSARATAQAEGVEVKWAGSTQNIGQISAHGSANAVFSIEAPKNLKAGGYPLSITLNYVGEDRANGTATFGFTVPVKMKADFEAKTASPDLMPGQKKETQVTLTNTGTEEARKVEVRIKPLFPFSTDGTVRYIDSLKPGESQNLTYVITVDKDATSGAQLTGLLIDFETPQGKKFSDSANFAMPVRLPTLAEELVSYWYVFALLAAGAIVAFGKRMKKK